MSQVSPSNFFIGTKYASNSNTTRKKSTRWMSVTIIGILIRSNLLISRVYNYGLHFLLNSIDHMIKCVVSFPNVWKWASCVVHLYFRSLHFMGQPWFYKADCDFSGAAMTGGHNWSQLSNCHVDLSGMLQDIPPFLVPSKQYYLLCPFFKCAVCLKISPIFGAHKIMLLN